MGGVLAFVDDIFFQMKIAETARHIGVEFQAATTVDALLAAAQGDASARPVLIVVDLNVRGGASPGANPQTSMPFGRGVEALERLRAGGNQTPVIAFLSHVQTDLAERARAVGGADVMPRSKFTQELATILARAKS
ncbi:MAG TPA: response regulator [Candidatus Acidoferrales bacterium]|nr:response regulator [Candidatus Acidoferrales bacterium]